MRHRVYGRKLGRNKNQRQGLFRSLVRSLLIYGTITTTETKAKAIKGMVDRIISLAKNKNTQYLLQSYLANKDLEERLVKEIVPKLENRVSGFTTMIRIGARKGDQTTLVRMSIIGSEKLKPMEKGIGSRVQGLVKKAEEKKGGKRIEKSVERIVKNKKSK